MHAKPDTPFVVYFARIVFARSASLGIYTRPESYNPSSCAAAAPSARLAPLERTLLTSEDSLAYEASRGHTTTQTVHPVRRESVAIPLIGCAKEAN